MVNLGIIGLGKSWEGRYRAALKCLYQRIHVQAVFDPVFSRADQVATEIDAQAETGLLAMARRADVDAVLLLETNWYGCESLRLLCSAGKPIFVAADTGADAAMLQAVHWTAVSFGLTVMPELGSRYTPASSRLQELLATRLGPAEKITVRLPLSADSDEPTSPERQRRMLIDWFDWAGYVFRSTPLRVQADASPTGSDRGLTIRIEFAPQKGSAIKPVAEIHLDDQPSEPRSNGCRQEIDCSLGKAIIETPTVIHWENGTDSQTETLTSDRNETEVMLDHFCRRVVGGLIPVADLADISRSLAVVRAVHESRSSGKPVTVNGRVP